MKNFKNALFYFGVTGGFTALMYWIVSKGKGLETGKEFKIITMQNEHWNNFASSISQNLQHPLAILLAQIITIIFVARFFGWVFR